MIISSNISLSPHMAPFFGKSFLNSSFFPNSLFSVDLTLRECSIAPSSALLDPRALHIWPRGSHFLMGLPNKDGSFTMTLYLPENAPDGQPSLRTVNTDKEVSLCNDYLLHVTFSSFARLMSTFSRIF